MNDADKILQTMNSFYINKEYANAIQVGQAVEGIDRYGERFQSTVSIYSTIATCYAILGRQSEARHDLEEALRLFKRAASYSRKSCDALGFWTGGSWWSKNPQEAKRQCDAVQALYQ